MDTYWLKSLKMHRVPGVAQAVPREVRGCQDSQHFPSLWFTHDRSHDPPPYFMTHFSVLSLVLLTYLQWDSDVHRVATGFGLQAPSQQHQVDLGLQEWGPGVLDLSWVPGV